MKRPILLVLAAGMGSRFGGLKQIEPLGPGGEIILDYTLYDAWRAGFKKAVLVIRRENLDDFKKITEKSGVPIEVSFAFQDLSALPCGFELPEGRVKPWGTGHAVLSARSGIDDVFGIVNADDFYGAETFKLLYDGLMTDCGEKTMTMVSFVLKNTLSLSGGVSRGVCREEGGVLRSITECHGVTMTPDGVTYDGAREPLTGDEPVSMNVFGMSDLVFPELEKEFEKFLRTMPDPLKSEFYIPSFVTHLMSSGVSCLVRSSPEKWQGVTYRADAPAVREALLKLHESGAYPFNTLRRQ